MKKLQYVLYALLILAILGLVLYDYFPDQVIDSGTYKKGGILLVGAVLGIVKAATRGDRSVVNRKAVYSKAYAEFIGTAFSQERKLEKVFYCAVDAFQTGKYQAALSKLEQLLPECQRNEERYAVTVFQGLCFDKLRIADKALTYYEAAQRIRPNSRIASNMGSCYARTGRAEDAVRAYQQAIYLNPGNPIPYNNLAQHLIQEGKYTQAMEYAGQALAVDNKMPQALSAMAICSYMTGDTEQYERYYRQAVSNGYDGNTLKDYIRSLDASI